MRARSIDFPSDYVQIEYTTYVSGKPRPYLSEKDKGTARLVVNSVSGKYNPRYETNLPGDIHWLLDGARFVQTEQSSKPTVEMIGKSVVTKFSIDGLPGNYELTDADRKVMLEFAGYAGK